jgi:site-specific DNA recombinase
MINTSKKIALIYCRVSTEDQEREGTSLQSQVEACLKLAKERGYEVPEECIFREVYSGLTLDRPDLTRLRALLQTGEINAVVIYSSDRFSRDGYDFLTLIRDCERAGVALLCVTEPLEDGQVGELLSYVRGWASKQEAEKIRERTMRGKKEKARQGKIPAGSHARLYGYNYIKAKYEGGGVRVVNEDQARWVREMFRWLVEEGLTVSAITYRLRALGLPTPSGNGYWIKSTVHKMLTNPAYTGKTYAFTQSHVPGGKHYKEDRKRKDTHIVFKPREEWIEIPNATPPIISEELFREAQARLKRNKRQPKRNSKVQFLLRGHLYCARCGRRYWGQQTGREGRKGSLRGRYYYCPGRWELTSPVRCDNEGYPADWLEEAVWAEVYRLLSQPELVLAELERKQKGAQGKHLLERDLEQVELALAGWQKRSDKLGHAYVIGLDEETFKRELAELKRERVELEARKAELEEGIGQATQDEVALGGIKKFCELVAQNLSAFTFKEKRLALEALQLKVSVDGNALEIRGAVPMPQDFVPSTESRCNRQSQ